MPPPGWTNPITVLAGQRQQSVNPFALLPSRLDLLRRRLVIQRRLLLSGTARFSPIEVTVQGVIYDGHHAVRVAAEEGCLIDVLVVAQSLRSSADSILDLPVV